MSWKIRKKYFSLWRSHISSYCLPNLIEQIWLSLVKTLIWHQEGKGVLYLSSASSEKFSIKSSSDCKTAYCTVNNRILKMPNIRTKQECIGAFLTTISWPQIIWTSAYSRSRDVALHHHSWWDFLSHFSSYYLNSQLCIFCFLLILYTTSFFWPLQS